MTRAAAPPVILERWMADLIDLFSPRTRPQILILVAGAVLAPGRRTVTAVLRVMGLGQVPPSPAIIGYSTATPGRAMRAPGA